jgi:hypothetical protein
MLAVTNSAVELGPKPLGPGFFEKTLHACPIFVSFSSEQELLKNLPKFDHFLQHKRPQMAYVCVYKTDYTLIPSHLFEFGNELIQALDNLLQ